MTHDTWTIKRVLDWTSGYLERKGDEHPRLSAEWLLAAVTGLSRVELYVNFDRPLEAAELSRMHEAIERRGAGEPLQYVTGEMPFRHIVLRCERGVLIPRPETEILVEAALEGVDAAGEKDVRVLEVGTGTGCVALSIASERPGTRVVATDLSERAVLLARRNREALGLDEVVDIVECDLASGVDPEFMGTFEVRDFEPELALDGGEDGLDVFRRLLALAPVALAPGGMLAVELFEGALGSAAELTRTQGGWASVEVREDLTHRPRVLVAVRGE